MRCAPAWQTDPSCPPPPLGRRGTAPTSTACVPSRWCWSSATTPSWPGFSAGLVGVDVFLVISGFVITAMLLREYDATGTVSWSTFFARRVRRLLPAAALMVVVVVALAALMSPAWSDPWTVPLAGVAALTSTANFHYWWAWRDGLSPGALGVSEPTPLIHTWTLSMEEQFYLVLPLVAFATLWLVRGPIARGRMSPRTALLVATVLLGVGSFVLTPEHRRHRRVRARSTCCRSAPSSSASASPSRWWTGRCGHSLLRALLGVVGCRAARCSCWRVPDRLGGYPGYLVLLPCLGAAALILARPRAARAAAARPPRHLVLRLVSLARAGHRAGAGLEPGADLAHGGDRRWRSARCFPRP